VKLTVATKFRHFQFVGAYDQTVTWTVARGYRIVAAYRTHLDSAGFGLDVIPLPNDSPRRGHVVVHEPQNHLSSIVIEMATA
jgi:hypothetical protein